MKYITALLVTGALQALGSVLPRAKEQCPYHRPEDANLVEDHYIVMLHEGHTLESHFERIGVDLSEEASVFGAIPVINSYRAQLNEHTVHELIRYDPGVMLVEHDQYIEHVSSTSISEPLEPEDSPPAAPKVGPQRRWDGDWVTDGAYCDYGMAMITAGKKIDPVPPPGIDVETIWLHGAGAGVHIYIFDTGIRLSHVRFGGRAVNFHDSKDSPYTNATMDDLNGHGTHIAGLAGGFGLGAAPGATLVNVKVLGEKGSLILGGGLVQAIGDVINEHKSYRDQAKAGWRGSVMNLSLKWGHSLHTLRLLMGIAKDEGIPIAAAAGNDNVADGGDFCYFDSCICVAASDRKYNKLAESNWGKTIGAIAPGDSVRSAGISDDTSMAHGTGTSQATAFVSGILATYVSWEFLVNKGEADVAFSRLSYNSIDEMITGFPADPPTMNRFMTTGINNPDKSPQQPYYDAPDSSFEAPPPKAAAPKPRGIKTPESQLVPTPANAPPGASIVSVNSADPNAAPTVFMSWVAAAETAVATLDDAAEGDGLAEAPLADPNAAAAESASESAVAASFTAS